MAGDLERSILVEVEGKTSLKEVPVVEPASCSPGQEGIQSVLVTWLLFLSSSFPVPLLLMLHPFQFLVFFETE